MASWRAVSYRAPTVMEGILMAVAIVIGVAGCFEGGGAQVDAVLRLRGGRRGRFRSGILLGADLRCGADITDGAYHDDLIGQERVRLRANSAGCRNRRPRPRSARPPRGRRW